MGSHSVTCHLTQVNSPCTHHTSTFTTPAKGFIYLPQRDGPCVPVSVTALRQHFPSTSWSSAGHAVLPAEFLWPLDLFCCQFDDMEPTAKPCPPHCHLWSFSHFSLFKVLEYTAHRDFLDDDELYYKH